MGLLMDGKKPTILMNKVVKALPAVALGALIEIGLQKKPRGANQQPLKKGGKFASSEGEDDRGKSRKIR